MSNVKMEIQIGDKILTIKAPGPVSVDIRDIPDNSQTVMLTNQFPDTVPVVLPADYTSLPPNVNLFNKLVSLRKQLSQTANLPAYAIFTDKTLQEMCEKLPTDLQSFSQISGVGQSKLEKYGELFLAVIKGAAA